MRVALIGGVTVIGALGIALIAALSVAEVWGRPYTTGDDDGGVLAIRLTIISVVGALAVRLSLALVSSPRVEDARRGLGRAWQPAAWGASLLAGLLLAVLTWRVHQPLLIGGLALVVGTMQASVAWGACAALATGAFAAFDWLDGRRAHRVATADVRPAPDVHVARVDLAAALREAPTPAARAALLDSVAARHLTDGTVPTGSWPGDRLPWFHDDPLSSTRLAQLDEKWRGLDR